MNLGTTFRQWASYGAVALCAVASIATSAPSWHVEDGVGPFTTVLDTNTPEAARHFNVISSQRHVATLAAKVTWDDAVSDPTAAVRLRLARDGGEPVERIVRVADSVDESGKPQTVNVSVSEALPCDTPQCARGYTATLTMVDGHPTEKVTIEWGFSASIGDEGDADQPDDAFVEVTED